jgi:hypothetical protein
VYRYLTIVRRRIVGVGRGKFILRIAADSPERQRASPYCLAGRVDIALPPQGLHRKRRPIWGHVSLKIARQAMHQALADLADLALRLDRLRDLL